MLTVTMQKLAEMFCERQPLDKPSSIVEILEERTLSQQCDGWMLLECRQLDSSRAGDRVILAFGPHNTYKAPPTTPISPRGLASDMSVVIAVHYIDRGQP